MTPAVALAALALLVLPVAAHDGAGQHGPIAGRVPPGGAGSWTVDEPVGLSYVIDSDGARQGALRVEASSRPPASHTIRIVPHGDGVRLEPQVLAVVMDDKVTWINDDDAAHTVFGTPGVYREPASQPSPALPVPLVALLLAGLAIPWRR